MIDLLRNLLSLSWWRDLFNQLTFDDLQARWELIQQAIANPQQHPLIAMLALAIILVLFLIVILTLAMWYFGRIQKQHEEYELLDEEDEVVKTVDKKTAEELLDNAAGIDTSTKINYASILTAIVLVFAVTVGFGFSTRTEAFCTACKPDPHTAYEEWPIVAAHDKLTCVNCHEPGNMLQGVTLNLFPRVSHVIEGAFIDLNDPSATMGSTYGVVTQASCVSCHSYQSFERTMVRNRPDQVTVRVSHVEPLEAGMSCTQCHIFSEQQESSLINTGMQTCVSCHNGARASVACANCHLADSPADTIQRDMTTQFWARQLIFSRPDSSCYDCHNPRSCDDCHGTRVPHTPEYMMHVHVPGGEMIHAYDYWRIGDMCYNCHFYDNASTAGPCSACHGSDFMPPPRRFLTPRQNYLLRQQNIVIDGQGADQEQ
ncbi:MAG: cytochrome c3 family protein [Coriobacteriia bacterium]|nr:cytochrome c3 family protein [Coriobacteriia bacterium]MCL2537258.1 cytochrome c3 family protein [Coriobacteriia bacterium]